MYMGMFYTQAFETAGSIVFRTVRRHMGQYCFARWRLSSFYVVVVCNAAGRRAIHRASLA